MVNFTLEQVRQIMNKQDCIRNISVIAHVDHGKSTLTDSLIAKAGLIAEHQAGQARFTDGRKDEKERGITIKSTGVTLSFMLDQAYIINLIDSPGHVDFSAEVTAALRVTDGALVVIDAVEGAAVQTETVLRQACQEQIKSVLMLNKMDRVILEMQLSGEEIYQRFYKAIAQVNMILTTYDYDILTPEQGQVAFGAGKDCWGFTLQTFGRRLAAKLNVPEQSITPKLWGDYYYNDITKKIQKEPLHEDRKLKRTFVALILDPIIEICEQTMANNREQIEKFIQVNNIEITQKEKELTGKPLLKILMSRWLSAADALLEMIVTRLPSPKAAQQYRTAYLYEGPQDDAIATAMRNCDPTGPLMVYISKFVPSNEKGHFYAFGRIFSGTVYAGQKIRIMGANYEVGKSQDLYERSIQRTLVMMGSKAEAMSDVPCGNTVALSGIDNLMLKTATITNDSTAYKIRSMKYSVSPVVRVAITVKNPQDLPKLVEAIQKLVAVDPLVVSQREDNGDIVIGCCGDLHAEISINDLKEFAKVDLVVKQPVVQYKETIVEKSRFCMTKSANKLNRLHAYAEPLNQDLVKEIESGKLLGMENKERAELLSTYDWDKSEALRVWCFGPENSGANILNEVTVGIQGLEQIKPQMVEGWQWATRQGVLTEEPVSGMKVSLMDCKIHPDAVHSGGGQILQASRRLYQACQLDAQPRLQEPIYLTEIRTSQHHLGAVYQCLGTKRGTIIEEQMMDDCPLYIIKAYLPVAESFGFSQYLFGMTQASAFPQCSFSHYETIQGNPLQVGTKSYDLMMGIRKRKGLKLEIPKFDDYNDKL